MSDLDEDYRGFETPQDLFDALSGPFPTEAIDWRVGSTTKDKSKGMALAYIDARAVMDRLDSVVGWNNWQCRYPHANGKTVCELGIRFNGEWIWKSDGAGDTDFEAEKGAMSDALKRAAVRFGIGRYLYDLDAPWVELEGDGKRIAKSEQQKLSHLHDQVAQRLGWGTRPGVQVYRLLKKIAQEFVTDAAAAQEFKNKNAAEIALLPVAMKRHLFEVLDRIGASSQEAA